MTTIKEKELFNTFNEYIQQHLLFLINSKYSDYIQIFTDGFVKNGGDTVGAGIYIPIINRKERYRLPVGIHFHSRGIGPITCDATDN